MKSKDVISKSVDKALDKAQPTANGDAGISVRNGPIGDPRGEKPQLNGHTPSKRKARTSNAQSYKDATSDSDDAPIVSILIWNITEIQYIDIALEQKETHLSTKTSRP